MPLSHPTQSSPADVPVLLLVPAVKVVPFLCSGPATGLSTLLVQASIMTLVLFRSLNPLPLAEIPHADIERAQQVPSTVVQHAATHRVLNLIEELSTIRDAA